MTTTITVGRDAVAYTDRARAYKVVVDGDERASVKNGGTATIEIEPGRHSVVMKIDWCRSPTVEIDTESGSDYRLRCRPRANPLTVLYYTTAARDRYIALWRC